MGSGKSAVGRALGEKLKTTVADLDDRIAGRSGCSVAEVFALHGEPAFRERECQALQEATLDGSGVIACGGGIVLLEANRTLLAQGCRTVWLDVEITEAARRVGPDRAARPLLNDGPLFERLDQLLRERGKFYAQVAIARIDTSGRDIDEVAGLVLDTLEIRCA